MPAMNELAPKMNSLYARRSIPTDFAAVSESRMAASTRPRRPLRRFRARSSMRPATASSNQ